jgi:hypothetical protein
MPVPAALTLTASMVHVNRRSGPGVDVVVVDGATVVVVDRATVVVVDDLTVEVVDVGGVVVDVVPPGGGGGTQATRTARDMAPITPIDGSRCR